MPILPEEVATATFTRVHRQGYHTGEVEAFLNEVAADYGAALEKMLLNREEPQDLNVGDEVNSILRTARESASGLLSRAKEEAEAIQKAAAEKAQGIETQASEARVRAFEQASKEATQVKAQADQYAYELRKRTEQDSQLLVERAEERARQLYAYNQQLSQHLEEIERLVAALRNEIDIPQNAWPEKPSVNNDEDMDDEEPVEDGAEALIMKHLSQDMEKEGV
jgi:DivIVA domain-containing protein